MIGPPHLEHTGVVKTIQVSPEAEVATRPRPEVDASTRHRVASSILEHGPSTAAELAERLGLTPAAIRRHLDALLATGQVEAREQRVYGCLLYTSPSPRDRS